MSYADECARRCKHCAAGVPMDEDFKAMHTIGPWISKAGNVYLERQPCIAPTEAEYIKELEAKLAAAEDIISKAEEAILAEADTRRLDWICADIMARKVYVRDYDENTGRYEFICCGKRGDSPRAAIDAAMQEAHAASR